MGDGLATRAWRRASSVVTGGGSAPAGAAKAPLVAAFGRVTTALTTAGAARLQVGVATASLLFTGRALLPAGAAAASGPVLTATGSHSGSAGSSTSLLTARASGTPRGAAGQAGSSAVVTPGPLTAVAYPAQATSTINTGAKGWAAPPSAQGPPDAAASSISSASTTTAAAAHDATLTLRLFGMPAATPPGFTRAAVALVMTTSYTCSTGTLPTATATYTTKLTSGALSTTVETVSGTGSLATGRVLDVTAAVSGWTDAQLAAAVVTLNTACSLQPVTTGSCSATADAVGLRLTYTRTGGPL